MIITATFLRSTTMGPKGGTTHILQLLLLLFSSGCCIEIRSFGGVNTQPLHSNEINECNSESECSHRPGHLRAKPHQRTSCYWDNSCKEWESSGDWLMGCLGLLLLRWPISAASSCCTTLAPESDTLVTQSASLCSWEWFNIGQW